MMNAQDKSTLFGSMLAGFLGALSYIMSQEIKRAEAEKARHMDDCRLRYNHQHAENAGNEQAGGPVPGDSQ